MYLGWWISHPNVCSVAYYLEEYYRQPLKSLADEYVGYTLEQTEGTGISRTRGGTAVVSHGCAKWCHLSLECTQFLAEPQNGLSQRLF